MITSIEPNGLSGPDWVEKVKLLTNLSPLVYIAPDNLLFFFSPNV